MPRVDAEFGTALRQNVVASRCTRSLDLARQQRATGSCSWRREWYSLKTGARQHLRVFPAGKPRMELTDSGGLRPRRVARSPRRGATISCARGAGNLPREVTDSAGLRQSLRPKRGTAATLGARCGGFRTGSADRQAASRRSRNPRAMYKCNLSVLFRTSRRRTASSSAVLLPPDLQGRSYVKVTFAICGILLSLSVSTESSLFAVICQSITGGPGYETQTIGSGAAPSIVVSRLRRSRRGISSVVTGSSVGVSGGSVRRR